MVEVLHGSYLQGMETIISVVAIVSLTIRTDPTYKEWKLHALPYELGSKRTARILPTRNGNR